MTTDTERRRGPYLIRHRPDYYFSPAAYRDKRTGEVYGWEALDRNGRVLARALYRHVRARQSRFCARAAVFGALLHVR